MKGLAKSKYYSVQTHGMTMQVHAKDQHPTQPLQHTTNGEEEKEDAGNQQQTQRIKKKKNLLPSKYANKKIGTLIKIARN